MYTVRSALTPCRRVHISAPTDATSLSFSTASNARAVVSTIASAAAKWPRISYRSERHGRGGLGHRFLDERIRR